MRSADEFLTLKLLSSGGLQNINRDILIEAMKDYATAYAKEALKNASENAKMEELDVEYDNIDLVEFGHYSFSGDESRVEVSIHKPSILSEENLPKHK